MPVTVRTFESSGEAAAALSSDRGARYLGGGVILFNFLLILLTPTMGLVWLALMPFTQGVSRRGFALVTLENFRTVLHSTFYVDVVWQTLLMSAGAATCVMALTVVAGWLAVRRRPGHGRRR